MKRRVVIDWKGVAVIVAGVIIAVLLLRGAGSLKKISFRKPLAVDPSATVVEHVRRIGELSTACYYEELVIKDFRSDNKSIFGIIPATADNEIVFIAKGKVRAGCDLTLLRKEDIWAEGDTLFLRLPPFRLTDVILNPSDIEPFYESGRWNNEQTKAAKVSARMLLRSHALDSGILEKAESCGKDRIRAFLTALGWKEVVFLPGGPTLIPMPESPM